MSVDTDTAVEIREEPSVELAGGHELEPELVDSYLTHWWMERVSQGRDGRIIIDAEDSGTGLGKTTAAETLCLMFDPWPRDHQWAGGGSWRPREDDKGTLDPREFTATYSQNKPLSWKLLDEAEQAIDRRRSMTNETLAVGHDFATKRYRQIFGVMTLPSKSMMDARIADKLCDLWIHVEQRGKASVYAFDENAFTGKTYYKKVAEFRWSPLDDHPVHKRMKQMKVDRYNDENQSRFVPREEFEEAKKNFWNKATAKRTYELLNAVYEASKDPDSPVSVRQEDLAQAAGMTQSNVSKIVNSSEFTDFYSSYEGTA